MFKVGLTGSIACGKSFIGKIFSVYNVPIIDSDIIAREVVSPYYENSVLPELSKVFGHDILQDDGSLNRSKLRNIVFSDKSKLSLLNSITHPAINARSHELLEIVSLGEPFPQSYLQIVNERNQSAPNPAKNDKGGVKNADKTDNRLIIDESKSELAQIAFTTPLDPEQVIKTKVAPYVILDIPLLFENNLESSVDRILLVSAQPETQIARLMMRDNCNKDDALRIISSQFSVEKKRALAHDIIDTDNASIDEKRKHVLNLHANYVKMGLSYKA